MGMTRRAGMHGLSSDTPRSMRVIEIYTNEIARRPSLSKAELAQRLVEFVDAKRRMWEVILSHRDVRQRLLERMLAHLQIRPDGRAQERHREFVETHRCGIERLRDASLRGEIVHARTDLASQLAIATGGTEMARLLLDWLDTLAGASEKDHGRRVHAELDRVMRLRNDLVSDNLRLVFGIAKRFRVTSMRYEDLIAYGNFGLLEAIDRFDPGRGVLCSTYAVHWIRHAIGRSIDQHGRTVRIPVCVRTLRANLERIRETLERERPGDVISDLDVARVAQVTVDRVRQVYRDTTTPLPLDATGVVSSKFDNMPNYAEVASEDPPPSDLVAHAQDVGRVRKVFHRLRYARRFVLQHRFGLGDAEVMTLEQIGRELGVSRERARQHEQAALQDLRDILEHGYVLSGKDARARRAEGAVLSANGVDNRKPRAPRTPTSPVP
jgi:RNA polymerase primary sigma factor